MFVRAYVYMCMLIYIYIYICMYVCIHVYVYTLWIQIFHFGWAKRPRDSNHFWFRRYGQDNSAFLFELFQECQNAI